MEPKRLLIVDDEVGFTSLVKLNLEKTGQWTARTVNAGAEAVTAAREFQPDAILLDIVMPDRDGGEVLAELQQTPDLRPVPVAFLTATVSIQAVAERDNQIHGVPFIAKPITPKELLKELDLLLKSKR